MARIRYFAECNGQPVLLTNVGHNGKASTRPENFTGHCMACNGKHAATRAVEYKLFPSKHACDARCLNATGRVMKCECSCGGRNHGRGCSETVAA